MTLSLPTDSDLCAQLALWLPEQRWFSGKSLTLSAVRLRLREPLIDTDGFAAEQVVVDVEFAGGPAQRYQIPLAYRVHPPEALLPFALPELDVDPVPGTERPVVYDATADQEVNDHYLTALAEQQTLGSITFRTVAGSAIDTALRSRPIGAEQSNTSIVYGEQLLLKLFRRLEPGINPDLELHRALADSGCEHVAPLIGWIESELDGEPLTLAMVQEFVANAADGWSLAVNSVRDLFVEADLHAAEVGTDFAGEAQRLGEAVAHVHADLARQLGSTHAAVSADTIAGMTRRLDAAAAIVPEIADRRVAAQAVFDKAATAAPTTVQRIHGDLHLGQALRAPSRWIVIDFEGEPVKTIAERRLPDSPLRDIAGMLRSFDYAGHHSLTDFSTMQDSQREFRAKEWTTRNGSAFCDGYASVAGTDPRAESDLLEAYLLDKAIYEAVYEVRHRPNWLPLPVKAITRIIAG
ncbi:maltokinase N-terminal cap-like domain-containing protein [Antrihabitans spumae]|uniref:Maltokinase n=1 Tax=Antrihabitans spumae TaxID=3373370 RepID=A0ABW7K3B5_9NOCA